jgi:IS5 family transposase
VIQLRHRQPSLWPSRLAKDIEDLWEPWMKEVDQLLEDAALVESVYDAQGKRHAHSRTRGRTQTPAEVALRLLILKHVRIRHSGARSTGESHRAGSDRRTA